MTEKFRFIEEKGLYDPAFEHDNCGIGAVIDIKGRESHRIIDDALSIVEHLEHRAGKDASGKVGDGVGILLQISHSFFSKAAKDADINIKDMNILENIDLNSIRNGKKKLIQKSEILNSYYSNKIEEDLKRKKINERLEKKLILQKQRQKEKERYTEYNQRLIEENIKAERNNNKKLEKSVSKQKMNEHYYNKIKNIEQVKALKKRPASSTRLISSSRKKEIRNNYNNNYSSMNKKKIIKKITNNKYNSYTTNEGKNIDNNHKYSNNRLNDKNNNDVNKKNKLYIQIFKTERNSKKKEISKSNLRAKTPINNYNKLKINKKTNKSQTKLNIINNTQTTNVTNKYSSNTNSNINSFLNLNCMTTPEEDKPTNIKYDKINKINPKSKNVDNEFWERKNVKIKNNNIRRKNSSHHKNERALSATPNKRNQRINHNIYDNINESHNGNKILKNYDSYINKDSYAYKVTKKNNYRYLHETENSQQTRQFTSAGNNYNKISSDNYKKRNFVKKEIYNTNELNNNKRSRVNQNVRKINVIRPNSSKIMDHDYDYENGKNYRRYNPDITEPELLMMINPIKIKDNYKNSQKSCLNITLNSNIVNQNIFLHHMRPDIQNINTNINTCENKEKNKEQMNNSKYNHLQLFNDYMNNNKVNDEPIKVINIFK